MLLTSTAAINFTLLHDRAEAFRPESFDAFIVTTRTPSSRLISAFNFNDPFYTNGDCTSPGAIPECGATARTLCARSSAAPRSIRLCSSPRTTLPPPRWRP